MSNFVSIRLMGVLLILGFGVFISFLMYNELIDIRKDGYACFPKRHYYLTGEKHRLLSIGSLNVYYKDFDYGCDKTHQYSPDVYRVENGQLVPKD